MTWANDNLANAQLISGASGTVGPFAWPDPVNGEPTFETGELHHRPSIWYYWVAPADGTATFTTADSPAVPASAQGFDSLLAAFDGPPGATHADLGQLAFNDDDASGAYSYNSLISFAVTAGQGYYVSLMGWAGEVGTVHLTWNSESPPPNDLFANRLTLPGRCGSLLITNQSGATIEAWESTSGVGLNKTLWWEWTSTFTGWVLFRSPHTGVITQLWQGPLVDGHPTLLAGAQDYAGERMCWAQVTQGATYYVQVDDDSSGVNGGTLYWQPLADQPQQTVNGSTSYAPTGTAVVGTPNPAIQRTNPAAPDTGDYSNPLIEDDNVCVDHHPLNSDVQYGTTGLYGVSITSLRVDPASSAPPNDAIIDTIGWNARVYIPGQNENHLVGAAALLPGSITEPMGSDLISNGIVHPTLFFVAGAVSTSLSVADAQTANFQIVMGEARIVHPATDPTGPYEGGDWQAERLRGVVTWHYVIGRPVPVWSCGGTPLRWRQRDDGLGASVTRGRQPSSQQGSLRHRGYV